MSLHSITTDVTDRPFDKLLIVREPVVGPDGAVPRRQGRGPAGVVDHANGDLTDMRHVTKKMVIASGIPAELSFPSWRHGGMTELGDADLTDARIRAISRHKDARTLPRYVKKTQRQIIAGTQERCAVRATKET